MALATMDLASVTSGLVSSEDVEMLEMLRGVKRMRINNVGKCKASHIEEENFPGCHKGTAARRALMEGWWEPNKDIVHALADHLKACGAWVPACKTLRLVNKYWCNQISQHLTTLSPYACQYLTPSRLVELMKPGSKFCGIKHLDLMNCGPFRGDRKGCFRAVTKLESLALGGDWVTNEVCESLKWQAGLKNLWVGDNRISTKGLKCLAEIQTLRNLDLHLRIGVSPACLRRFEHLENLKVSCATPVLDEEDLLEVSFMDGLKGLSLVNTGINLHGMKGLAQLSNLVRLEVWCDKVYNLDQACQDFAQGLPNLRFLGLISCQALTNEGLGAIAGLAQLSHLSLIQCPRINAGGMRRLASLEDLRFLKMYNNRTLGLRAISHLHKLEELRLGAMDALWDGNLTSLHALTCLTSLKLFRNPNVGGMVMLTLAGLPLVRDFELVCCKAMESHCLLRNLQSACFGPLRHQALCDTISFCPGLVSLSLMECVMSPYALQLMGSLNQLRHLRLWHCGMLTMEMLDLYSRHWMNRLEVLDVCPMEQFQGDRLRYFMLSYPHLKLQETTTVG